MPPNLIFLPVLLQVLLTLFIYVLLSREKSRCAKAGQVNEARRALYEDAWPESVVKINHSLRNQSELPVLFYVVVFVLWALNAASPAAQLIAWLFALSRLIHARIHLGVNVVRIRRPVFTFGFVMVVLLWAMALWALLAPSRA